MSMTPKQIKRALEDDGLSMAGLARDLNVSRTAVQQVVYNITVSHRIRCHIAKSLNKPVEELWSIKNPGKKGRTLTHGLYDREPAVA